MSQRYWLMKTEPTVYSIDDLQHMQRTAWEGVRNYQARNFMRDDMQVGDQVLIYHSSTEPPGVAGLGEVCKAGYPDFHAWDQTSKYFDSKSDPANPRWFMVDVKFVAKFPAIISLHQLKSDPALSGMLVTQRGVRLSVQPVAQKHFERIVKLGQK